jgi:hypothetical protein
MCHLRARTLSFDGTHHPQLSQEPAANAQHRTSQATPLLHPSDLSPLAAGFCSLKNTTT